MMTSRRNFLKGILALTAVSALPAAALALGAPAIVGDGVHNDAPGLNALFAGKPFMIGGKGFTAEGGVLRNGAFRLDGTVHLRTDSFLIDNCAFDAYIADPSSPIFSFHLSARGAMLHSSIKDHRSGARYSWMRIEGPVPPPVSGV